MKKLFPGFLAALAIALPAWFAGKLVPIIGGPIFAILAGMLLSYVKRPASFSKGIDFSGKKILQYSIIFLGFGLDLGAVAKAGLDSLGVMVFTLTAAFLTAFFVGRLLKIDSKVKILIGVGTAICGGSAIAATAPVIDASEDDIAFSISTIFMFNIIAVFVFPALGRLLRMGQLDFGLWAGTAINDTSSVVAAAFSYGDEAGRYATVVKLTRTLMIIPVTMVLAFLRVRKGGEKGDPAASKPRLAKIFPWFVLGFLAASFVRSIGLLPTGMDVSLTQAGKFGICMAMAAIGLKSNPASLIRNGIKPILLGLACWSAVTGTALLAMSF
jgi:uncharacterized integral membrane protein (TIGR00698 family)